MTVKETVSREAGDGLPYSPVFLVGSLCGAFLQTCPSLYLKFPYTRAHEMYVF